MRFFAELKKAYASIEAMSAVPEGGGVWIYDNFYLIKRSYSDICASKKAIRRFLEEKDTQEIAQLLGRPKKTVETQLYRARAILQKQIKEVYSYEK